MKNTEKEKIESKGAYSYDLHEAIRDVRRAFTRSGVRKIAMCLEALRDICAPEIRDSINSEWVEIDKKYHNELDRVKHADFEVGCNPLSLKTGWVKNRYGGETFYSGDEVHASPRAKRNIAEKRRREMLRPIWLDILHNKLQACINCLDRHGELRKWREVDYGRV